MARRPRSACAAVRRARAADSVPTRVQTSWAARDSRGNSVRTNSIRMLRGRIPFLGKAAVYLLPSPSKDAYMWILALRLYAFLWLPPLPNLILLACIYTAVAFFIIFTGLIALAIHLRISRREYRSQIRLVYEETPEPAVQALSLLR